jgi:hypothetical protein
VQWHVNADVSDQDVSMPVALCRAAAAQGLKASQVSQVQALVIVIGQRERL